MKRLLSAIALVLTLGGCARQVETDQARLCRMALPALNAEGVALDIVRESEDPDGRGVEVVYRADGADRRHVAHCRYVRPGRPNHSTDLASLALDGESLGDVRLFFLIRFWLATPEGRAADPAPLGRIDALPQLPPRAAYALQQTVDALPLTSVYALLATAYALIYGLIGRINFAFGALAATGGYAAAFGASLWLGGAPAPLYLTAGAFAVFAATGWGAVSGAAVFAPLRGASAQRTLVATVGLAIFLSELLRLTQGSRAQWVPPVLNTPFGLARAGDFIVTTSADALLAAAVSLGASVALVGFLRFSRFGRDWRACADDTLAAQLFGVDPDALLVKTFALASALAGLAGFLITMFYGAVGYDAAATLALKSLAAAVLGGVGSLSGAWIGGLVLGGFEAFWSASFPTEYRDVAVYAVLALTLALRPQGLFGRR